jgi:pimeloyl-ACP methyl ester carboxylesterase
MAQDYEQPPVSYSIAQPDNRVSKLLERIHAGSARLAHEPGFGYPRSVLWELEISESLQVPVFSKTSLQRYRTHWASIRRLPRSATEVADESRHLLQVAAVPAPYLLVGHSLGGLYARRLAQRFPNEVAAILLIDPAHESYPAHMPKPTLYETL